MTMGAYSKAIGAFVGGLLGLLSSMFALPAEWASPEMASAITLIASTVFAFMFPKNTPGN